MSRFCAPDGRLLHHLPLARLTLTVRSSRPHLLRLLAAVGLVLTTLPSSAQSLAARSESLEALLQARGELATLVLRSPQEVSAADQLSSRSDTAQTNRAIELGAAGEVTSLAVTGAQWIVAGDRVTVDDRRVVFVQRGDRETVSQLGLDAPEAPLQTQARLLTHGDELVGLAWMQGSGSRRLVPWFASFDGNSFVGAQPISEPGRGSQTGLTATALNDGSVMVVWVKFDGVDDEIVARRWDGAVWSETTTLTANEVPDVSPSVIATEGGALVAWSRYENRGYRIALARIEGGRKIAETSLGQAGSHYPSLSSDDAGRTRLLFFDSPGDAWNLLELAPEGRVLRSSRMEGDARERPAIVDRRDHVLFVRASGDDVSARWNDTPEPLQWKLEDPR